MTVNGESAVVADTAWSKTVTLKPGANNFIVVASKDGYSDGKASVNIAMDNAAPTLDARKIFMIADGSTTQTPVQTITGVLFDASPTTVTVTVNGQAQAQVPVNDGVYCLAITLALGKNVVAITATDVAGNASLPVQRTITYDPQAAAIVVNVPNNAAVTGSSYTFSFTTPAGVTPTVTVNGLPATVTAVDAASATASGRLSWTATADSFVNGLNLIEISTVDAVDASKKSFTAKIVTYNPGLPSIAVTAPAQDATTAKKTVILSGKATAGAAVSALVNGQAVPVNVTDAGDFSLAVTFGDPGRYLVVVSATDADGNTSYGYRSLIYDTSVPTITFNKGARKYSATNGILYAKDKDGNFVTDGVVGSGTATLDVSNYNGSSVLNVFALSAGGNSSRNGDLSQVKKGYVDISDALKALQFSIGMLQPTDEDLLYGDISTLNGKPVLDGKIRLDDVITILHKAVDGAQ